MSQDLTRRTALQTLALGGAALSTSMSQAAEKLPMGMRGEGPDTPKICLAVGDWGVVAGSNEESAMKRIKQLGVHYILTGVPKIPWKEEQLRAMMDKFKAGGLTLANLMIGGFPNAIYGKPGRDAEIELVQESVVAAGKVGLPVGRIVHRIRLQQDERPSAARK